jgi:hypothetical protein
MVIIMQVVAAELQIIIITLLLVRVVSVAVGQALEKIHQVQHSRLLPVT